MSEATTTRQTARRAGMNGVLVAGITAVISGISVFANSYGVHHVPSPSVYTTGKNLVAMPGPWCQRGDGLRLEEAISRGG